MTPIERQREAQEKVGYGPLHLRRQGEYVLVDILWGGLWVEVIREHVDSNFSHIVLTALWNKVTGQTADDVSTL
jgi:hypothetical protein